MCGRICLDKFVWHTYTLSLKALTRFLFPTIADVNSKTVTKKRALPGIVSLAPPMFFVRWADKTGWGTDAPVLFLIFFQLAGLLVDMSSARFDQVTKNLY